MMKPPLILTIALDKKDAGYFNQLRQQYFPAERNFIDAHLTLFHALPNEPSVLEDVSRFCANQRPFEITVLSPVSIGKGVAFKLESEALMLLHKAMQQQWFDVLSLQDRHKIWPHITVQNKVTVAEVSQTLSVLKENFTSFKIPAPGLQLWEYLNGPWKFLTAFSFMEPV